MDRGPIYRLMIVVTIAVMSARIASSERVYEPSIHQPEPKGNAASIAAGLAADSPLQWAAIAAEAQVKWAEIDPHAPPRYWPRSRPQPMPTYSSNDRSRWATARALVEDGTFVIGRREYKPDGGYRDSGRIFEPGYESVDKVKDPKTNLYYSSKPPLLTVIVAGEYWLLHRCGFTLQSHPWLVVRLIVWMTIALPLWCFLLSFAQLVERYGESDWGRLFSMACACFGTFLSTFSITLNNHVPASVAAYFAVNAILADESPFSWGRLLTCGLFAGLATCFELPAAALLGGLAVGLLFNAPLRTLFAFAPAAALPIALSLGLNFAIFGQLKPVYSEFESAAQGETWYRYPGSHWNETPGELKRGIDWAGKYDASRSVYRLHLFVGHHGIFSLTPIWLLSFAAMLHVAAHGGYLRHRECLYQQLMLLTLLASLAAFAFYGWIVGTVNYGGWTCGPRWFFWLAPLWLMALVPAADRLAESRLKRGIGLTLLATSVFSAAYPAWNPWRHPWIFNLMDACGGIPY